MSTKPKPKAKAKATPDSTTFKQLPEKTKDLMKLKDQEERTIGPEQVEVTKKIDDEGSGKEQ